jgi:hypothetical protein
VLLERSEELGVLRAALAEFSSGSHGQIVLPAVPHGIMESWDTGFCPSFLPGNNGGVASPGDLFDNWASLENEAIAQTEELYRQTGSSDSNSLYATDYARGVTRAFMFADLVEAIDDVAAGKGTATAPPARAS